MTRHQGGTDTGPRSMGLSAVARARLFEVVLGPAMIRRFPGMSDLCRRDSTNGTDGIGQ